MTEINPIKSFNIVEIFPIKLSLQPFSLTIVTVDKIAACLADALSSLVSLSAPGTVVVSPSGVVGSDSGDGILPGVELEPAFGNGFGDVSALPCVTVLNAFCCVGP